MSEQADIEAALARATAAYKNVRAELDALKDANDRAEAAEAERDRLREALESSLEERDQLRECIKGQNDTIVKLSLGHGAESDQLRDALEPFAALEVPKYAEHNAGFYSLFHADVKRARAALAKEAGQSAADKWEEEIQ